MTNNYMRDIKLRKAFRELEMNLQSEIDILDSALIAPIRKTKERIRKSIRGEYPPEYAVKAVNDHREHMKNLITMFTLMEESKK